MHLSTTTSIETTQQQQQLQQPSQTTIALPPKIKLREQQQLIEPTAKGNLSLELIGEMMANMIIYPYFVIKIEYPQDTERPVPILIFSLLLQDTNMKK
jgi:hypothetical protein